MTLGRDSDRMVTFWQEEKGRPQQPHEVPLWRFLQSLPYPGACGIFPPRQALNSFPGVGRTGGGRSPGAHGALPKDHEWTTGGGPLTLLAQRTERPRP